MLMCISQVRRLLRSRHHSFRNIAVIGMLAFSGCTRVEYRAEFKTPNQHQELNRSDQFLKCHMKDGSVYVLERWTIPPNPTFIEGTGILYDANRTQVATGWVQVPLSGVELLETNDPKSVARAGVAVMAIVTGASLAVTALCVTNPKACFGSCPTFFADDGTRLALQAEGFSSSIARSLEANDLDAMWTARPRGRLFDLLMTNEALETHVVDHVRVVAVPRPPGGRVFRSADAFYSATAIASPLVCRAESGDCLGGVEAIDSREYASTTDGKDLSTKETLELEFPATPGAKGIVVAARNSLLNTFLLYQALSYMGRSAADWYMRINRSAGGKLEGAAELGRLLGDIDIEVGRADRFEHIGSFSEVGPIAREVQLVPLPNGTAQAAHDEPLVVRLTMTRGNWKLDHVGLATLGGTAEARYLDPVVVLRKEAADPTALRRLLAPGQHLITYPGDAYTLRYELPVGDQELFLDSRGYYYEWIREDWLKEESQLSLVRMLLDPSGAMQRLAPAYKKIEADMDRIFWQSRVGVK
jgi:hypothetical protein